MAPTNKPDWASVPKWVQHIEPTARCAWIGLNANRTRSALLTRPLSQYPILTVYDIQGLSEDRPQEKTHESIADH